GAIKDKLTRDLLLSDTRLKHRKFLISGISILALTYKSHDKDMTKKQIFEYYCDAKIEKGRRSVEIFDTSDFDKLLVGEIPYPTDSELNGKGYVICPISMAALARVNSYILMNKKLTFEMFRDLVWREKGKETPEYHMMIEWVTKHLSVLNGITKSDVIDEYENLLREMFEIVFWQSNIE